MSQTDIVRVMNSFKRYQGAFQPPAMGRNHVPFPIGGDGELTLADDGLVASGFKVGFDTSGAFVGLVFLTAVLLAALLSAAGIELDGRQYGTIIAGMIVAFVSKKKRSVSHEKPLEVKIPWDKVKWVKAAPDGAVHILVEKHSPKGLVYFYPNDKVEDVVTQIQALTRT